MPIKGFLVPIGVAIAAILPAKLHAAVPTTEAPKSSDKPAPAVLSDNSAAIDPVFQELNYPLGSEAHALILRQSNAGVLYAGHGSHVSHHSHSSHQSHRSGY